MNYINDNMMIIIRKFDLNYAHFLKKITYGYEKLWFIQLC